MRSSLGHRIITGLVLVISVLLFVTSCKTSRILSGDHKAMSSKDILQNYYSQDSMPEFLSFRFNASIDQNGESQTGNVYVRMKQDSIIWISVRAMSLEGMRLVLTQDSLKFVDRLNSLYWIGDYRILNRQFPGNLDFNAVQNILLAKMHDYSGSGFGDIATCNDSLYYCLQKDSQGEMTYDSIMHPFDPQYVSQKYLFYPDKFTLASQVFTSELSKESLEVKYGFSESYDGLEYPGNIILQMTGYNSGTLQLVTKSVTSGKRLKMPIKIPDKYEQIRL